MSYTKNSTIIYFDYANYYSTTTPNLLPHWYPIIYFYLLWNIEMRIQNYIFFCTVRLFVYFKDLKPSVRLLVSLKDLKPSVMFYYEMLFLCPIGFDLDFFLAFLITAVPDFSMPNFTWNWRIMTNFGANLAKFKIFKHFRTKSNGQKNTRLILWKRNEPFLKFNVLDRKKEK